MGALKLGNDPRLNPNGIDATAEMGDDDIGPGERTDFIVKITNNSSTSVKEFQVFVKKKTGSSKLVVMPSSDSILRLDPGETEECHFLVINKDKKNVQTQYTFGVQSQYFGLAPHSYGDFVKP